MPNNIKEKPSICFVAPAIWPVLSQDTNIKLVGGAEVQQTIMATELINRGYKVTVVCQDFGQGSYVDINGIKVYSAFKSMAGLPGLRFIHPRSTGLWLAMQRANADIYYQRSAGYLTGLTALFSHHHGKKMIYASASDTDFVPGKELIRLLRDKIIYRWGMRRADAIVVQNKTQMESSKQLQLDKALTISNCSATLPDKAPYCKKDIDVLWVSTLRKLKQPELVLQIAKILPSVSFTIIGGSDGDEKYYRKFAQMARQYSNVVFKGFIPYSEIGDYFDRTKIFLNTSKDEGFPNTFLQAWSRRIPTVSFFKLDLTNQQPGLTVEKTTSAAEIINKWLSNESILAQKGRKCSLYFKKHNSAKAIISSYENLFKKLMDKNI